MKIILKIAWRNLWRHTRRTLLTVATVSLGLALLLIFLGLGDGGHYQMIESAVRMGSGHVVIQKKGYQKRGGIDRVLDEKDLRNAESWAKDMNGSFPIRYILRRTLASGLASSSDGAAGVQIIGIQPREERKASQFDEKLIQGEFLDSNDGDRVIIGEGVARKLSLNVGEKMVMMAQAAHTAEIQSLLVRVGGIMHTGLEEFDQIMVLMPLATSQKLLMLKGEVHQVAILMESGRQSESLAAMGKKGLTQMEVLSWGEVLPELKDFIRIDDGGNYVFQVVIFLLIGFTVVNTLLMSVLERNREFALMDALGLTPGKRFLMVILEAIFIATLSVLVGFVLGYAGHLYLHVHGLPLDLFYSGDITAAGVAFEPIVYSELSLNRIVGSMILVFGLTLLLAILPARRAARIGDIHLLGHK
jgi:ABC-type lipoprotein release transport system permease subunit